MTEERKNLYRKLLYAAMVDLRGHSYESGWQKLDPQKTLAFVNSLTDWLHNLALHASQSFADFDEPRFWRDYQVFREKFPADRWASFLEGVVLELRKP